jgi:hypothetical protein
MNMQKTWRTAILAVSESGLPAWTKQTAGRMPAFRDRLEARPPFPQTIAAALLTFSLTAHAATDYTLSPLANSTTGHRGSSADYTLDSTATPGGVGDSADYSMRSGYAGQLAAVSGIAISAPSLTQNESSTQQLTAEFVFDDGSRATLDPASLTWSVQTGPVTVSTNGLATAAAVYQNQAATIRADKETFHETLALTIVNSLPDNYGSYAADGLPDSWQIQYFGLNAALAGKFDDFDGDDVSNLLEYAAGTHPASLSSGVAPLSYQGNTIVPGNPIIEFLPAPGVLPHRAVFIRRKDAPLISYLPQFSRNLTAWPAATTPLVVLADDGVLQVVSHRFPVTIGGLRSSNKYFRLHVAASAP